MYRVVRLSASLRAHRSNSTHNRWLGLFWLGVFAASTLASMTLGSTSARAECQVDTGGAIDTVICLDDDLNGVFLNAADPAYGQVGPGDPTDGDGILTVTSAANGVEAIDIDGSDVIDFNIFTVTGAGDDAAAVDISATGTDTDAIQLTTTSNSGHITFSSGERSTISGTNDGLRIEAETNENTVVIDVTSFSDISTTSTDFGDAAISLEGEDGEVFLRQHGTLTSGRNGALIVTEDADVTAEFWGQIDPGAASSVAGVVVVTTGNGVGEGNVDVTLHSGANVVDTGGSGVDINTEDGHITATVNSQIGTSGSPVGNNGVSAQSGDGNMSVTVGSTGAIFSAADGILITQDNPDGTTDGTIDVNLSGGVTSTGADGVDIDADDSVINVSTALGGTINTLSAGTDTHGIEISADNQNGEDITVYVGDTITTAGGDGVNIVTSAATPGGLITVGTGSAGDLNVARHGVNVSSVDHDITENIGENITAGLSAVRVEDGEVVTLNFGDATNTTKTIAGDGDTDAVVNVLDYDQDSTLTNYSTVRSTATTLVEQADDLAIDVNTADATAGFDIANYNTIIGRINGSIGANTVDNFSADSWIVAGVGVINDFGDGEDIVNNFGRTVTALSAATTVGTGPDYGLLTMIDQSVGQVFMRDMTTYSGDGLVWTGGPNSQLGIDAFLGGASDTADLLVIEGDNAGTTAVRVNDINGGAGVYNPDGILFATVDGTSPEGSFFLSDGPIDKGFFSYDVIRDEADTVDWLLASAPNGRAFELPKLVTGAQTIWHETTGVWLDRTADLRRTMECAPAPVAAVNHLPPLKLGPSDESYGVAGPCYQQRFGVWGRGFGGDFDRSVRDRTTLTVSGSPATFNGNYSQDLAGAQGGADVVLLRPNSGYGALFVGVLGGFVESDMDFKATKDKANFDGGTVGVYGTYVAGPWYADLLFKADLLDLTYKTSFQGDKASTDADSFGIRLDTGYRFNTGPGFFVDPQGTLAWVDSDLGNLSLLNSTTNFGSGESLRGRLGLRAGYSGLSGTMIVEPFAVASVWHEFEGDNKAALMSNGYTLAFNDSLDETWGEVGGGLNVFGGSGGGSAFVKADALVGSDLEGWKVTGGGRLSW